MAKNELPYHMQFTIGDDSGDGHCKNDAFHIVANHSAKEINAVMKKLEKELGHSVSDWASDYEDNSLPQDDAEFLHKLGFFSDVTKIPGVEYDEDYEQYDSHPFGFDGVNGYVTFMLSCIVKHYLPDFKWETYEIPNEECLSCLDGNGYGLYS